jgi:hypothetical protein
MVINTLEIFTKVYLKLTIFLKLIFIIFVINKLLKVLNKEKEFFILLMEMFKRVILPMIN